MSVERSGPQFIAAELQKWEVCSSYAGERVVSPPLAGPSFHVPGSRSGCADFAADPVRFVIFIRESLGIGALTALADVERQSFLMSALRRSRRW
jgi:hypothetical protein